MPHATLLFSRRCLAAFAACLVAAALAACGGGGAAAVDPPPPDPAPVARQAPGWSVVKARAVGAATASLEEKPASLMQATPVPVRRLALLRGNAVQASYTPPDGWLLLDFALHPSGQLSLLLATDKALKLARLDAAGQPLGESPLQDAQVAFDPAYELLGVRDPAAMLPFLAKDTARLAPLGEHVVAAVRTGMHAVVAYRYDWSGGFARRWRTLVEPGVTLPGRFLTSGSHDTFNQLVNHFSVALDAGADGTLAVAVPASFSAAFEAHAAHFGQAIAASNGALVTRLSPAGERLGTTVIDTGQLAELHALRATGEGFALAGRVRTERRADGFGWDAWAATVGADGRLRHYRAIDVQQGDALFDIVPAGAGRYLAAGAAGYWQNPAGASVSEEAAPLLLWLNEDLSVRQRVAWEAGPRHNQLRTLAVRGQGWLVGGLQNGPGTHSGDTDASRITADGLLRELRQLP